MKKKLFIIIAAIMLLGIFAGCNTQKPMEVIDKEPESNEPQESTTGPVDTTGLKSIEYPQSIGADDYEAQQKVKEDNQLGEGVADMITEFSSKSTAAIIGGTQKNACYSPVSLYMALALLTTGASGETKQELTALLGEEDTEFLSEQMGRLFRLLYINNEYSTLYMTNSLWINQNYAVKQDFIDNAMENYYAAANNLDFADESAGEIISRWISENTAGLLEPEVETDPLDLLFIINTVYLKDQWLQSFDESQTQAGDFILGDGGTVSADFMHNRLDGNVYEGDGFTAMDFPLRSAGKMVFVLPDEGVDAASLLSDPESAFEAAKGADREYVSINLSLPKFSFENEIDLVESLKTLGMVKAFNEGEADLSGISDLPSFVSSARQGTVITVDENGLEAAAFTEIVATLESAPAKTVDMVFDRPFLFIVQSNAGVPLFVGIVQNPAE